MNFRKFIYPGAVILLIISFNLSLILAINRNLGFRISLCILVLLGALIAFKNRSLRKRGSWNRLLAVGLIGVALSIVSIQVGFFYAILGLLLLMLTQLRIVTRGKPESLLIGGNPMHKLDETEWKLASAGLAMMISVLLTFILSIVWMAHTAG